MFGKLKERLKSFFKKAEEKAEEKIEQDVKEIKKKEEIVREIEKKSIEGEKKEELKTDEKEPEKIKEEEKSLFGKIKSKFKFKITEEYFDEIFSELEFLLLENNVAFEVVEKIKYGMKIELLGLEVKKQEVEKKIEEALRISLDTLFPEPQDLIKEIKNKKEPYVILFFGINGSGKTTTIAKIAYLLSKNNISCIMAASDTFRAASIEQLEKHASNLNVKIIKSQYKADPASVAFDAIVYAKKHNIKAVLIDTAGRMYTKVNLMKEMGKIAKVSNADLKIFVAESITGNDAVQQAKTFNDAVGIDSIILTKTDVDEKGGAMISVSYVTSRPIIFLGTGQNYEDLEKFDKNKLIKSLGF